MHTVKAKDRKRNVVDLYVIHAWIDIGIIS